MDNSLVPLIEVAIYFCILKSSFILYRAKYVREMRNFLFLIFRCVFASRSFSFERTVSLCSRRNDRTGTRGVTSFCSFFFKLHRLDAKRESFERSLGIAIVCPWRTRISFQPPCVPSTCVKMRANREGAPRRRDPLGPPEDIPPGRQSFSLLLSGREGRACALSWGSRWDVRTARKRKIERGRGI